MKKLIENLIFGHTRTEDVEMGNFLYEKADYSRVGKQYVPGGMTIQEWEQGGWSKYNHPECKVRKLKRV